MHARLVGKRLKRQPQFETAFANPSSELSSSGGGRWLAFRFHADANPHGSVVIVCWGYAIHEGNHRLELASDWVAAVLLSLVVVARGVDDYHDVKQRAAARSAAALIHPTGPQGNADWRDRERRQDSEIDDDKVLDS